MSESEDFVHWIFTYTELRRPRFSKLFCFAIILLLLSCSIPIAFGAQATVRGVVRDIDGNPIGGVVVTIYDINSGSFVTDYYTLSNGYFSMSLDLGTYRVQIEKKGYESKSITSSVTEADEVIDFGIITLDYSLKLSISQIHLRVNSLSEISLPEIISNKGPQDEPVIIQIEAPDGWEAGIYSGSAEVKELTLSPAEVQSFTLKVQVPFNSSGPYELRVRALGWTTQESVISINVDKVDPLILTSTYPTAQGTPGSTVIFNVGIKNALTKRFTSQIIIDSPRGWTGTLIREDGNRLYDVSLESGDSAKAMLRVDVPENASAGNYEVITSAKAQDFASSLIFHVIVTKGAIKLKLRTDMPYVDAYAGRTATYSIEMDNTGDSRGMVSVNVTGLPTGYKWTINDASGNTISKFYLNADEMKKMSLIVDVPPLVEPQIIPITLEANAPEAISRLNLTLGILGFYDIAYVTQNFYMESTAGTTSEFQVQVENKGYSSLTNVILNATNVPNKFKAEAGPSVVLFLRPQDTATFTLKITTDADINAGDYYVTLNLKADQSQLPSVFLHVYVKQRGEMTFLAVVILIVLIGALFLIYRRYGKR